MLEILDSTGNSIQLILALTIALVFFVASTAGYARFILLALILFVPFQPITSKYGTINMVVTYLLAPAIFLAYFRERSIQTKNLPLIIPFTILLFAYLISWALAPTGKLFFTRYLLYMIQLGSNVLLFYMCYVFFKRESDLKLFFRILIFSNLLVIAYSLLQLAAGGAQVSFFGISDLSLHANRTDQRLVGPFNAVGITAEYLVIQSMILGHYIVKTGEFRKLGALMLLANITILIGTGNRGGFICSILAVGMFMYLYRRNLGLQRIMLTGLGFVLLVSLASFFLIRYTEYNVLYDRLLGTEIEGVTPDTRSGWDLVLEQIVDRPVTGHGPRIVRRMEFENPPQNWPKANEYLTYWPHSLYLFILYTTGAVGIFAFMNWGIAYWMMLVREKNRNQFATGLGAGLPALGMAIFVIVLIDQLKIEFLRYNLSDYHQYLAVLFGMFAALGKIPQDDNPAAKPIAKGLLIHHQKRYSVTTSA